MSSSSGKAFIFSAPSGSGKTTIVRHLLDRYPGLSFSISATTRSKRAGEIEGKDYYFLTEKDFREKISEDEFLEWEEVYTGIFYGTLRSEVERIWSEGKSVIFDVDVKGGIALKKALGKNALAVFVKVSDLATLKERLSKRGTESEEMLQKRLEKAEYESTFENQFDISLKNDQLDQAFQKAEDLYENFIKDSNKEK